jgi:hypothetical protein
MDGGARTYQQLLEEAQELGRLDGAFAAAFEPADLSAPHSGQCLGRAPAEFARLLWEDRPGTPPSGLEVNAPLWYAAGFDEGLRAARSRVAQSVVIRWVCT